MCRSSWATKAVQERILAIKIKRQGFDWLGYKRRKDLSVYN
jgi:hypothetical protein